MDMVFLSMYTKLGTEPFLPHEASIFIMESLVISIKRLETIGSIRSKIISPWASFVELKKAGEMDVLEMLLRVYRNCKEGGEDVMTLCW